MELSLGPFTINLDPPSSTYPTIHGGDVTRALQQSKPKQSRARRTHLSDERGRHGKILFYQSGYTDRQGMDASTQLQCSADAQFFFDSLAGWMQNMRSYVMCCYCMTSSYTGKLKIITRN
ncbi:Programmed cell death protein 6 [Fusarium oxysporum f. sp. albedinis]|nr:Programmed cell death protein 6 [Fusarium oxysporum f. sp. albedinis]